MMDPLSSFAEGPLSGALVGAVFIASLLGSLHCVGMCGPFVAVYSAAQKPSCKDVLTNETGREKPWLSRIGSGHVAYHGGRAVTYIGLGALGGSVGSAVDWAGSAAGLVSLAALVSGVLVVLWGLGVFFPRLPLRSPLVGLLGRKLVQLGSKPRVFRASLLGIFTPLLPCGWLYAFVVTAAGTGSAASGALLMGAFWLGTVPALLGTGAVMHALGQRLRRRLPVVTGAALICIGVLGVAARMTKPLPQPAASGAVLGPACH